MTQHPAERIRNKFTPFLMLVELLTTEGTEIKCSNPTMKKLLDDMLQVCNDNKGQIHDHLCDIEEFMSKKSGLDYEVLTKHFNAFLKAQTKEDLEKWLEMDKQRMLDSDAERYIT
jgi:hypothetical protein